MQKVISLTGDQLKALAGHLAILGNVKMSYKGDLLTVESKDQEYADRVTMDALCEILPPVQEVDHAEVMRRQLHKKRLQAVQDKRRRQSGMRVEARTA